MDYRDTYPFPLILLSKIIDYFLITGGIIVLSLIFINAVLRGTAGFDLAWSLEITAFLLLWLTFLGCSAATARRAHMRVTEVVTYLVPKTIQPILELFINLIIIALLIILIIQGYNISSHTWTQKTTVLYWPVGLLYASLPVGMAVTFIFHCYNIFSDIKQNSQFKKSQIELGEEK